jgi:methionyl-tRNA formyltransferase
MGRGRKFLETPVKSLADKLKLNVIEIDNLNDENFINQLKSLSPDLFVVVAYKVLPQTLLDIPRLGSINLHSSLLPKYRGAAPIQHSIMNGDEVTGVSTFIIEPKVDTGNILLQKECKINEDDNYGTLSSKLSTIGAELLIESINKYNDGSITPVLQDNKLATLAPKIKKEDYIIDWNQDASIVNNKIRAFSPYPGAYTLVDNKRLKIFKSELNKGIDYKETGKIINLSKEYFEVTCSHGSLKVYEIQIEGKKRMSSKDFIMGFQKLEGVFLG